MALTVGVDAYASLAGSNTYNTADPYGGGWADLDNERKEALIRLATRLLDEGFRWLGDPAASSQALGWPRSGLETRQGAEVDSTAVPTPIADATAEFARRLDAEDLRADQPIADMKIIKAGDTSFDEGVVRKVIPAAVVDMIPAAWVATAPSSGSGFQTADLYRV